ncbi:nascent polypeptide-associated complex subunit alpha, muscle-specific form-like isoform X2 [Varanus komodoensis]|uniref:nascent polypeptide-associated complex subunit alpha, muscle-specific form-like isoform X2 n=1 Tax=Varanus komodoensis TaxID=61221 RepID=UPI001CF7D3ED|nr:nascent polypeptide-associated complex subunit alpha, muscle-specific form-like isoform X2 [Varanus komodoensis]
MSFWASNPPLTTHSFLPKTLSQIPQEPLWHRSRKQRPRTPRALPRAALLRRRSRRGASLHPAATRRRRAPASPAHRSSPSPASPFPVQRWEARRLFSVIRRRRRWPPSLPCRKPPRAGPPLAPCTEKQESLLPGPRAEEQAVPPAPHAEKVAESAAAAAQHVQEGADAPAPSPTGRESAPLPTQHTKEVEGGQPGGSWEEAASFSFPSQPVEPLPGPKKLAEKDTPPPGAPTGKPEEAEQLPLTPPVVHLPELAEPRGSVSPGEPSAGLKEPPAEEPHLTPVDTSPPKEVPEPPPVQPLAPSQEQPPQEPAGVPPAQVRQANKSSDHHRFGRAKPSHGTVADTPEELLVGSPAQESRAQGGEASAAAEGGCASGTSPRSRASHRKAAGQPLECAEAPRDVLREGWELEASAALKKKKRKQKQKRSQQPRAVEPWEDSCERPRAPKPEVPFSKSPESAKEISSTSREVLERNTCKHEGDLRFSDPLSSPPVPAGVPAQPTADPPKPTFDAKAGEAGGTEAVTGAGSTVLAPCRREEPPEGQLKHHARQSKPGGSPVSPPAQASPVEPGPFAAGRPSQSQSPWTLGPDASTLEPKLAVGEGAPAAVGAATAPEGPAPAGETLAEKAEEPKKGGKCERAQEGAAKPPGEAKAAEAARERERPTKRKDRVCTASELPPEASPLRELSPGDAKDGKSAAASSEVPFVPETKPDSVQPLAPASTGGGAKEAFAGADKGACPSPSEQPAGPIPRPGNDQPKKRGSDGKSKRARNHPEQQQRLLLEDKDSVGKAPGLEVARAPADTSPVARSPELGVSGTEEGKAALSSAGLGEKPKKRTGSGKSRKAAERISFGPPYFPEVESSSVHLAAEAGGLGQAGAITEDGREGASASPAGGLPEAAAAAAEAHAPAAPSAQGKAKAAPSRKSEWVDFPPSAYPFLLEMPGRQMACPAALEAAAQAEGTDRGKGSGPAGSEGPPTVESPSVLPASKPKKRTSDGRSKRSGRGPAEQPPSLDSVPDLSKPSKKADAPKEAGAAGAPLLEQPDDSRAPLPAAKLVGRTEEKEGDGLGTATPGRGLEQPPSSGLDSQASQALLLTQPREAPLPYQSQEAGQGATDLLKSPTPLPEPVPEEGKKRGPEGQSPQTLDCFDAKSEPTGPAPVQNEAARAEEPPSSRRGGEEEGVGHPLGDAEAAVRAPVVPLDEAARGTEKGKKGKDGSSLECPFLLGTKAEADVVPGAEREAPLKERAPPPSRREDGGSGSDPAAGQDPLATPAKRGSDRKSRKTAKEAGAEQHPELAGFGQAVEELELVDENRNVKGLPAEHQMRWEENPMSLFGSFAPPGSGVCEEAASKSWGLGCPFLERPGKFVGELSKEQGLPTDVLRGASEGEQKEWRELQADLGKLEGREATIETSLLVKAGDETREKRKKGKRPPAEGLARQDGAGGDQGLPSVPAEGSGAALPSPVRASGPGSLDVPGEEESKMAAGRESGVPAAPLSSGWSNEEEATVLRDLAAALVGGPAEQAAAAKSHPGAEQKAAECLGSLGGKAGADEALEEVPAEEAGSASKPEALSECPQLEDVSEPKASPAVQAASTEEVGLLREAADLVDTQRPGSRAAESAAESAASVQQADRGDQVARETRKEGRAKAPQPMKGYMRPTKSRGLPPPPPLLKAAAQEQGRRRPAKPDGPGLQRQEKAKPEEAKPDAEVERVNDAAAPPSKELPPSPEKKAKPSAATPAAKPAATKTKPMPAAPAATPTKRPASATPGQTKKATSPTAGPAAAAATPKRPATSAARPATLTPKDAKPKGTDVKSPDKRPSPSKPPSAATPRPNAKGSPAAPKPTTALTSLSTSSPRSATASPPKRPSTIKTDAKPTDAKKTPAKSPSADLTRPKSAPASTTTTPAPAPTGTAASRPKPKPAGPRASGTASTAAEPKKASTLKAAPKTSPVPKPPRPPTSASAPDLKNVRSKIGSTDNIKHQPGGGKAKVERKAESAGAARKPELSAVSKTATAKTAFTKEGAQKQPNGKVQIVSKKANYSHVQSKCGSKDNIKHVPGGGNVPNAPKPAPGSCSQPSTVPKPSQGSTNVQILNKKIDLSRVASKCGSKANIKHKPGGGDVKIENQKLNFKEKAQAKVGSLDNVGHTPAGGTVKTEGGEEAAPQNGAATAPPPPPGSGAPQENGVGPAAPALGGGDQRETQSFDTHIPETN